MPEVISNTSPLQYLYQLDLLELLSALYGEIVIPHGVAKEIAAGRTRGVSLPVLESIPWIRIQEVTNAALLPLVPIWAQESEKCSRWLWNAPILW